MRRWEESHDALLLLLKERGGVRVKVSHISLTCKDISKSKNDQFANVEYHYNGLIGHINKYRQKFKRDNKIDKSKENKNDDNSDADTVVHFIRR